MGPRNLRCEGQTLVYCPGGWMNFDVTPNRRDCAAEGAWCVAPLVHTDRPGCWESLGECDPKTFKPRCDLREGEDSGESKVCIGGNIFYSGTCFASPSAPAAATP